MPFSYTCTNPSCKQVFETLVSNDRCKVCYMGRLKPSITGEGPADTFPARGAPMGGAVVRCSNLASGSALRYAVTDAANRDLRIDINNGGKAGSFEVGNSRVVQLIGGNIAEWVILSPTGQPDWGHFGATAMQTAIRNLDREPPPSKPIYLRLGFQHDNNLHVGFGLVHILFSHNRQSFKLVSDDIMHLIKGAEMRESFHGCSVHKDVHLAADKAKAQQFKCVKKIGGRDCGAKLTPKNQMRIFRSTNGGGNRYVLANESIADGSVLLAIFENRDDTYNLVTMYRSDRKALLRKKTTGEFLLLYPKTFS